MIDNLLNCFINFRGLPLNMEVALHMNKKKKKTEWKFLLSFVLLCSSINANWFDPVSWGCRIHQLHLCRGIKVSKVGDLSRGWPKDSLFNSSIPRITQLYPWFSPYSGECLARWHQVPFFESLVWLDLGLNLGLPDHWRTHCSLGQWPDSPYKCPGYVTKTTW